MQHLGLKSRTTTGAYENLYIYIYIYILIILQNCTTVSKFITFDHQPSWVTAVAGPIGPTPWPTAVAGATLKVHLAPN
jgi:hypothetical protein